MCAELRNAAVDSSHKDEDVCSARDDSRTHSVMRAAHTLRTLSAHLFGNTSQFGSRIFIAQSTELVNTLIFRG